MSNTNFPTRWISSAPYLLSILRIVAAFLFLQYGTAKLFAFPAPLLPGGRTAPLTSLIGVAALLEFVGGTLLLMGLFTRPVAFVLAGEMAVAYFKAHAPQGFWPLFTGGVPSILFCFIWLYISAAGPGPLSLDALLRRRRVPAFA
jgi:putative oxidoreductase